MRHLFLIHHAIIKTIGGEEKKANEKEGIKKGRITTWMVRM